MTPLLAISNAAAGTASEEAVGVALARLATEREVIAVATASPADLDEALARHTEVTDVVLLGGDGSLHAGVAALRRAGRLESTTVGLVPLGTGNDFAATVGLPTDPRAAVEVILHGRTRAIDLAVDADDRVVVNAAHVGIGAEAAREARPYKRDLGPLGYVVGAAIAGARGLSSPGARVTVTLDGERLDVPGRVLQVAVGNGRFVGGGADLLPEADPTDGLLDVAVVLAGTPSSRLGYALELARGRHHLRDDVLYRTAREIEVTGEALACTSDGELIEPRTRHHWRVLPGALTLCVPEETQPISAA